jgi:hypothetical protein
VKVGAMTMESGSHVCCMSIAFVFTKRSEIEVVNQEVVKW